MKNHCRLLTILCSISCVLLFLNTSTLSAQENLTLTGQVVIQTEGASISPGLKISFHMLDQNSGQFITLETTTNEMGDFQFNDVSIFKNGTYLVTTDYSGTRYSTTIDPSSLSEKIKLSVYETTQDISIIRIKNHSLVLVNVDPKKQLATAATFISLTNDTNHTLLPDLETVGPGQFSFLRFSLPHNAENLDVQSSLVGGQIIPTGNGFAITAPIVPGAHNISFSYEFGYDGTDLAYKHGLLQGADLFQVLVPQSLNQITVELIESTTSPSISNESYLIWETKNLTPGHGVTVVLSNLPQRSLIDRIVAVSANPNTWLIGIPTGLGTLLVVLLLWSVLLRLRRPKPNLATNSSDDRNGLISKIALLDNQHSQGTIEQTTYLDTRSRLIEQVIAIDTSVDLIPYHINDEIRETSEEESK